MVTSVYLERPLCRKVERASHDCRPEDYHQTARAAGLYDHRTSRFRDQRHQRCCCHCHHHPTYSFMWFEPRSMLLVSGIFLMTDSALQMFSTWPRFVFTISGYRQIVAHRTCRAYRLLEMKIQASDPFFKSLVCFRIDRSIALVPDSSQRQEVPEARFKQVYRPLQGQCAALWRIVRRPSCKPWAPLRRSLPTKRQDHAGCDAHPVLCVG